MHWLERKKAEREERQGKELKGNLLPGFAAAVKGPKKSTKELEVIKENLEKVTDSQNSVLTI